jgi:hypothetical protein
MASAQKVAAVAASTAVLGGGAAVTVEQVERHAQPAKPSVRAGRERPAAHQPAEVVAPQPAAEPIQSSPTAQAPSRAERREREAKRRTPPAQQEFEPAWAAAQPAPSTEAGTATASPAPAPTRSGGGAEEFAP